VNLDELAAGHELLPDVFEIAQLVSETTGKEIDFRPADNLSVTATIKIARERMERHILYFDRHAADRLNYVIAHESGHALRMLRLDPADRRVPVTDQATLAVAARDMGDEITFLAPALRPQMLEMWVGGLVQQLTNQPVDVRIERWLHANYPGLRSEQVRALRKDAQVELEGLSRDVERLTPPTIFRFSNAMNYAYLSHAGRIIRGNYLGRYRKRPEILKLGQALYEASRDEGMTDWEVINRWVEHLGVSEWFRWVGFEDMPESYFRD
jgi:hypothetical protein